MDFHHLTVSFSSSYDYNLYCTSKIALTSYPNTLHLSNILSYFHIKLATVKSNMNNKSVVVSHGKLLKINKAQVKDSGLYECSAKNGVDQDLRRIIQVKVRGKLVLKI